MMVDRKIEARVIDRNAAEVAGLFDWLREALIERHGVTIARYATTVPEPERLTLKVSASPPIRSLAVDFVENRRHELLYDMIGRMRRPDPSRVAVGTRDEDGIPEPLRAARRQYNDFQHAVIGDGWWHVFDVPTFGPYGRRGIFLINPPLAQPISEPYMTDVRNTLQQVHLDFCVADNRAEARPALTPDEREVLLGLATGLRMGGIAERVGLSPRTADDRLRSIREKLGAKTAAEAVAKAVRIDLIP
jgi:DNA-binding CsgD family transcriptional regulator